MEEGKVCLYCESLFVPRVRTQVYCTRWCRDRSYYEFYNPDLKEPEDDEQDE